MLNAVEYLREKERMTNGCIANNCINCPLSHRNNGIEDICVKLEAKYPEKAVEIVENWSKEHPVKTYLSDFLEKYPNAIRDNDGTPKSCVNNLYNTDPDCVCLDCDECWNRPLDEMEERHD